MSRRPAWRLAALAGTAVLVLVILIVALEAPGAKHPRNSGAVHRPPGSTGPGSTGPRATVPRPAPAVGAPTGLALGASVNHLFNDRTYSPSQIDAQLTALRSTGATLARSDALWELTEPVAPHGGVHLYDWSFDDKIAAALAAHHLIWLPILDYSAPWAESVPGRDHSAPSSDAGYSAYAQAFARRYGSAGSFWREHPELPSDPVRTIEIWNEPDNPEFWSPQPDATRYADLYITARAAIDAVDPSARVIVGGLTNPTEFLPAMLQAAPQLRGHLDGVAIHPYGPPQVVLDRIRSARATLRLLGLGGTPLYVTEFGWTTSPPTAPDYAPATNRPGYIVKTLTDFGHLDCEVAAAVLYAWVTPQRNLTDGGDWYGIHGLGGASTPDSAAFTAGLRAAAAPGPALSVCGGN